MASNTSDKARWGFYLAWLPMTALVVVLLAVAEDVGWLASLLFSVPLCAVYAVVCSSAWYLCRAFPPRRVSLTRLLTTHGSAALLLAGLWLALAHGASQLFPTPSQTRLHQGFPLLFGIGLTYYLLSVAFHYLILALEESQQAETQAGLAQALAREAELKALRAQLNPHFLFNSLHSISALTTTAPKQAREMCITLSEFLRGSLAIRDRPTISLREEVQLAKHYLAVEKIRFAERLTITEQIAPDCLARPVPPLLLQPLVENAVTHGVAGQLEGGWIKLDARLEEDTLVLVVENSYDEAAAQAPSGGGHGLAIVKGRLAAQYRGAASLLTEPSRDHAGVYRVTLRLPAAEEQSE